MENKLNFSECTLPILEDRFGLRLVLELPALTAWLQRSEAMSVTERDQMKLVDLQDLLLINANNWNEQELSLHFIGPIFSIIKFSELHRYNLFAERYIEATVQNCLLVGEPDEIIASGYFEPKIPYFVFAEYKRQRDPNGDPAGQALAAMKPLTRINTRSMAPMWSGVNGILWL